MSLLRLVPAALVLALAGCRTPPPLRVTEIEVAKDATFDLLPPGTLGQDISLEQLVDARYGDKTYSFHCLLEVDRERLVLVGMTPFNTRAFTLTLQDEQLSIDVAPGAQLPAEPSRILADLQLALWPNPTVRGLDLVLFQTKQGDMGREFKRGETPILRIVYDLSTLKDGELWSGELRIEQLEQDYSLAVKTIRAERLAP